MTGYFGMHMDLVLLVYGAAFLVLGGAVLLQPRRDSRYRQLSVRRRRRRRRCRTVCIRSR